VPKTTRTVPSGSREFERIAWLSQLFAKQPRPASVMLGIGDDAAIVKTGRNHWVWTVDACVQGVHFDWRWLSPIEVGWRSFHAAVSDVAAMGASPLAALCSLALPKDVQGKVFRGIAQGQARAARSLGCAIIGGNLTRASEVSVHTTVLGATTRPICRAGARIADEIWVFGNLGAAAAGLIVAQRKTLEQQTLAERWCARQWRRPTALIRAGRSLRKAAHAAIDVSDGLVADLGHVADASCLRAVIDAEALDQALDTRLHKAARALDRTALEFALFGGEDYALIAAGPARRRPDGARAIGQFEKGSGVWLQTATGRQRLSPAGFDHFR